MASGAPRPVPRTAGAGARRRAPARPGAGTGQPVRHDPNERPGPAPACGITRQPIPRGPASAPARAPTVDATPHATARPRVGPGRNPPAGGAGSGGHGVPLPGGACFRRTRSLRPLKGASGGCAECDSARCAVGGVESVALHGALPAGRAGFGVVRCASGGCVSRGSVRRASGGGEGRDSARCAVGAREVRDFGRRAAGGCETRGSVRRTTGTADPDRAARHATEQAGPAPGHDKPAQSAGSATPGVRKPRPTSASAAAAGCPLLVSPRMPHP